jgi:hypothetical protein
MATLLILLGLLGVPAVAGAQEPPSTGETQPFAPEPDGITQELVLKDGSRGYGRVERVVDGVVFFRTASGAVIEVASAEVVAIRRADGTMRDGEFWRADPNATRLFFAPTGRSLRRAEGYFGVYEVMLPFVQVGITDRISFGAGTPLFFGDGSAHPFWITPKAQIVSGPNVSVAVGVMHFLNVSDGSLGIAYTVLTHGSADSAWTGGLGWGYERGEQSGGSAVGMIGGEHRVGRRVKLVTENYMWSGGGLAMGGVRWFGDRLAADLGMVMPLGEDVTFVFPMVNFVWKFSRD